MKFISKYHPVYQVLKDEGVALCLARLESGVLFFALGLLLGFRGTFSLLWGICGTACLVGAFLWRTYLKRGFFLLIFACFLLGIGMAQVRLKQVEHPTLFEPRFHISLKGVVEENIVLPERQIVTVSSVYWPHPSVDLPNKIQLNFFEKSSILRKGDRITFQASLFPPKDDFELFSRQTPPPAFFKGIGAFGVLTQLKEQEDGVQTLSLFEKIRFNLARHLLQILPENSSRIAIALITGEQKFVSKEQYQLYRKAGITHVLSVSGFHMALLAGFLFFVIRGVCALMMGMTLRFNSKKIAAIFAWIGTLLYLMLSGAQVPALRSFGMISLVFLGILTDRVAFSKRSLFLVATLLLICCPENILSISFQLSFLSVLVLISVHEVLQEKFHEKGRWRRIVCEFVLLNLLISVALMPLIAGSFHLINPYGFLGNLMLSVLFSFGIMPCLFIGSLLWPICLDGVFFKSAGYFLSQVEGMSSFIAQFPFTEIHVPSFPMAVMGLFGFGLVVFCTFHRIGKGVGIFLWLIALIWLEMTSYPQVLLYNDSMVWVKEGQVYENELGQAWVQKRGIKALGFMESTMRPKPDFLMIQNQKIAFKSVGCAGAKAAFLTYPDSRCHVPTVVLKPNTLYQIFITPNRIQIKQGDRYQTIKS